MRLSEERHLNSSGFVEDGNSSMPALLAPSAGSRRASHVEPSRASPSVE
jgi:hypothetical protein